MMSGDGLEVLLEGLIPEIAYSGEKGIPISELLKIVRQYHLSLVPEHDATAPGDAAGGLQRPDEPANLEASLSEAEMASARWAWDWLRSRPQILINGNKRWNRLELSEALALPEAGTADGAEPLARGEAASSVTASQGAQGKKSKKVLTTRPRIHPSEDLVWQTLTRHGVDYKRVPALEWACLQGIATARAEGILQSDLRRLVDQDKRSLPKRTDSLARKGYIAKRTVVVQKMKTSRLWLIDFAPPLVEEETCGLDLSAETLSKDTEPVPWHQRWTGNNIDMDALGRTVVGIVKAWSVIRYSDLRSKMGVSGKRWQMKTLAKNCQRLVDMGVFKYTAASFPGASRKVFKDCLKFVREPSAEEWDKFLATGKKTSQYSDPTRHRVPKPNALALYGKSADGGEKDGDDRAKLKRIFSGWSPEKPIAQSVFEVIRSAGPEGASNPQISVATVGYQHRRYMSSYLTKVAETKQPPHLKKFQVVSKLVRTGKTSAYMFSAPEADSTADQDAELEVVDEQAGSSDPTNTNRYGFGAVRPKAFGDGEDLSLSDLSRLAKRPCGFPKRKLQAVSRAKKAVEVEPAPETAPELDTEMVDEEAQPPKTGTNRPTKRDFDMAFENHQVVEDEIAEPAQSAPKPAAKPPGAFIGIPNSLDPEPRRRGAPRKSLVVKFRSEKLSESADRQISAPAPATPDNQVNRLPKDAAVELASEDIVLPVQYNGIAGKLRLSHSDKVLSFVRSGRGKKKPLIIPINDSIEEATIRDVQGDDDRSLVFAVKAAEDDTPSQTYDFIFDNQDAEIRDTAAAIQRQVIRMKTPRAPEVVVAPVLDGQPVSQDDPSIEAAPQHSGPTSNGGRGRGGGGGRGRKGRGLPRGAKPYVCTTCGGTWKNDLGLKYHLEKAQVPCNPNFDPALVIERSRKRRRLSTPPAASPGASEAAVEGTTDRSRKAKRARKPQKETARPPLRIRAALRSIQGGALPFRGLDFTNDGLAEASPSAVSDPAGLMSRMAPMRPVKAATDGLSELGVQMPVYNAYSFLGGEPATAPGATGPSTPIGTAHVELVINAREEASRAAPAMQERFPAIPAAELEQSQPLTPLPTPGAMPVEGLVPGAYDDAPLATDAPGNTPSSHAPINEFALQHTGGTPLPDGRWAASPSMGVFSAPSQSELPQIDYPEPPREEGLRAWPSQDGVVGHEQAVTKPFAPSTNYARMATDAKRRTAQAFDIINHLLDNTCGVFPGEKALFYAVTKVFLKEFRNQMPPTWKNCQSAVKALENRKLATLHTHMLKTKRGRLQTCALLIRTGVDPAGIIPNAMKQKMREAYPGIFIPPAFSPTQEELALLQELDGKPSSHEHETKPNANGQKFRSRRKIDDIEVFNAPYYTQSAPAAGPRKDPLWTRELEQVPDEAPRSRKRSVASEYTAGPFQKRTRTGLHGTPTGPRSSRLANQYDDDIPVDPEIMGSVFDPSSPSHGRSRQRDVSEGLNEDLDEGTPSSKRAGHDTRRKLGASSASLAEGSAAWDRGPPSVVEAIKAYSLLPSMGSHRAHRSSTALETLRKIPPELGRLRNPGLNSLPASFFGNVKDGAGIGPTPAEGQFLDPNASVEGNVEGAEEDHGHIRSTSLDSSEGILNEAGAEESQAASETGSSEPGKSALPSALSRLLAQNLPSSTKGKAQGQEVGKARLPFWAGKQYAKFCSVVDRCAAWEQSQVDLSLITRGTPASNLIFVDLSPPLSTANAGSVSLRWSDETQFNLETLPYEDLEDDEDDDAVFADESRGRTSAEDAERPPKKRRTHRAERAQGVRRAQGRPPKLKLQAIKTMREHTAYPRTAEDLLRLPGDENEELDWSSENVRLAAFIVVTTLLGGVDRVVDWGLMLRLMPDQTISQLRHYWCGLKKDRQSTIVSLSEKFRHAFLKAYENNEIPPINFDDVLSYDWKGLIKWTTNLDGAERRTLPASREALEENFTLRKFKHGNREWREAYYHPQRSVFNKFQDATSEALAFSVDNITDPKPNIDMVVAMSWTRSLCVTPVEAYSADSVLHRRNSLYPDRTKTEITELITKGVDQLQRMGVISKSSSKWHNGRRWRFNTRVVDILEKAAQQEKFAKAVEFKRELDQAFRDAEARGEEKKKRVTYITNDGMIMALLNMQANGRIRVETTGQPNVPLGHEPGNYETRKYTKKYLHFRLDLVPTESYMYDDDVQGALAELRARIKAAPPPTKGPGGAVPVWCDVFGKVDADRWLKYLSAVLITLASRGSMRAEEVVKTLKPIIMVFEAELIMGWAEQLGLLRAQVEGAAPALMEWWWIAVEAQREALAGGIRPRKSLPSGRPQRVVGEGEVS